MYNVYRLFVRIAGFIYWTTFVVILTGTFYGFYSSQKLLDGLKSRVHCLFEHFKKDFEKTRQEHAKMQNVREVTTDVVHLMHPPLIEPDDSNEFRVQNDFLVVNGSRGTVSQFLDGHVTF